MAPTNWRPGRKLLRVPGLTVVALIGCTAVSLSNDPPSRPTGPPECRSRPPHLGLVSGGLETDVGLVLDARTGKPLLGVVAVIGDSSWDYATAVSFLGNTPGSTSGGGLVEHPDEQGVWHQVAVSNATGIYMIDASVGNAVVTLMKPGYRTTRIHYPRDFPIPVDSTCCCGPRNTTRLDPTR